MNLWNDPAASVDERVDALLAAMTLDEKVGQLASFWPQPSASSQVAGDVAPMESAMSGGLSWEESTRHGLGHLTRNFGTEPVSVDDGVKRLRDYQRQVVDQSRFGIPAIAHEECLTGLAAWKAGGKVLLVLPARDEKVELSCRNLREVRVVDTMPGVARLAALAPAVGEVLLDVGLDHDDILLARSEDGGLSWSDPVVVDRAPRGVDAFTPMVDVDSTGRVAVSYYDFRNDEPGDTSLSTDVWLTHSHDGGRTFCSRTMGASSCSGPSPRAHRFRSISGCRTRWRHRPRFRPICIPRRW